MNKKRNGFSRKKNIEIGKLRQFLGNKRQKFVLSVFVLAAGLFFLQHFFDKSNVIFITSLSFLANLLFLATTYDDLKKNLPFRIFILPFLFTFSFGLFYTLVPARFLTRILISSVFAVGMYSLFLSQNIFLVASIRTITLLSSARIVSFVLTLVSYFFLLNIVLSFHLPVIPLSFLVFILSFVLISHSLWTHTLNKSIFGEFLWVLILSFCLFEISLILSLWPTNPTVIALFMTGFFYTIVGITQVWFDKRLFKGVLWEYVWVAVIVFFILILFTSWR